MTTGEYGGIGSLIRQRNNEGGVMIAEPTEGMPADLAGLKLDEIKTKAMKEMLNSIGASKSVVITPEVDQIVVKSARNIPGVVTTTAKILSVYDIVNAGKFIVDKAALAVIEEVFA